jgi:hypothetical protein
MTRLSLQPQWLDDSPDSEEGPTFAEVTLSIGETEIGGIYDPDSGETAGGPRLPAALLAAGLVNNWWRLLYEPQKTQIWDVEFEYRHRLDSLTRGYVFPPVGIWSGGEAVNVDVFRPDLRFQRQLFVLPDRKVPWSLAREDARDGLADFVKATLDRMSKTDTDASSLRDEWERIVQSTLDSEELTWCINAGRLGFDPYDPNAPDVSRMADGLSDSVFSDICEATDVGALRRTCDWVQRAQRRLTTAPSIQIRPFGMAPRRELDHPAWRNGYGSAKLLRRRLNLTPDPVRSVDELLGASLSSVQGQLDGEPPNTVDGLSRRSGTEMRLAVSARSTRQRRFRMCRAAYLAWRTPREGDAVVTSAFTWRQQASRAFAAELLAPAELLKERAGRSGLTPHLLDRLVNEWSCPPQAIIHQAQNHKVPLRGVETSLHN